MSHVKKKYPNLHKENTLEEKIHEQKEIQQIEILKKYLIHDKINAKIPINTAQYFSHCVQCNIISKRLSKQQAIEHTATHKIFNPKHNVAVLEWTDRTHLLGGENKI